MKLSQIGTKLCALFLFTASALNSFAAIGENSDISQDAMEFQIRLNKIYADKNCPHPNESTSQFSIRVPQKTNLRSSIHPVQIQVDDPENQNLFENPDSTELTLEQLLSLEPKSEEVIDLLNQQTADVDYVLSNGVDDALKTELSEKRFFLESSKVIAKTCRDKYLVSKDHDTVTACQTDKEIHFDINWLKNAGAINRAKLINHELILAWVKGHSGHTSSADLEKKVVELDLWLSNLLKDK